jgi:hypothetical protein
MFALPWQIELTHLGIAVIMDDYNEISLTTMDLRFPDGIIRSCYLMWAAWIADPDWIKFAPSLHHVCTLSLLSLDKVCT